MDFDLFELEDDDILSSVCVIPTEETETFNNPLPEFNCSGEDSLNSQFSTDSFVKNFSLFNQNNEVKNRIELTPQKFKLESFFSKPISTYIFGQTRLYIQSLAISLKGMAVPVNISFYERRRQVTLLLHLLHSSADILPWGKIKSELYSLRSLMGRISTKELFSTICMANSTKGNETDTPAYHLLHGLLEWKFLYLLILNKYQLEVHDNDENKETQSFLDHYNGIMEDLVILSICLFKKKRLSDLLFTSPFPCTCVKESWLLMQLIIENVKNTENFWIHFNKAVERVRNNPDSYILTALNVPEFIIWLLKSVARLQGFKTNGNFEGTLHPRVTENFDLLEMNVENFFTINPSEEQIRVFLCGLMPLILEWWNPKVDIPMILWEHFHKKFNSSFFISGTAPSNLAVSSSSGKGYLNKMKSLLENSMPDVNLSSFCLFTIIVGKTVQRFIKQRQNNQMQKILGRIYSKFSSSKFLALNETGIHHLIELFLSLALSADLKEVAPKLKDKLLSLPLEKISASRQVALAKGHVALIILFSEQFLDISDYVSKLLEQLGSIKYDLSVSKVIAEGFCDILKLSNSFDRGEHLLIDSWLPNFLSSCTLVEQGRTLESLHMIFAQIQDTNGSTMTTVGEQGAQKVLRALSTHILPYVKQNFVNNFSQWLPMLAADFCLAVNNDQFHNLFKFFLDANSSNKQALPQFLLAILSSSKASLVDASTIMQVWLKSLVILSANNEDVMSLTRIVCTLPAFREVCNISPDELLTAKEPLCVFVSGVGKHYDLCEDFTKKCMIADKFNAYLLYFEKWLSDKNEKTEVTFRFYSFIAIVIFNCANIVYIRSKISCFFHIAMTRFIIPCTIQVNKAPEPKFAQIIHKVWPVIIQGIGKLNFKTDSYVAKTLTDLIVKWTPHFKVSNNSKIVARPFINCFSSENESLLLVVFEKLTSVFLAMQRRQADPNACLVITIFQEVVETIFNDEQKIKIFMKATCFTIMEHLMMVDEVVPSRGMLLELLKKVIATPAFSRSSNIRDLIIEHLKMITVKHLSYFTFFYFELLTQIVNICPQLVEEIMDFLQEQIKIVEEKRGGGEDNRLRTCYEKLKGAILACKSRK